MENFSDENQQNMTLQSTSSSRPEASLPNLIPDSTEVNANDPVSNVLRNPLILDALFDNLRLPDLKTARLVCHDWNDVGLTLLGKRAPFHINKFFTCTASKYSGVPPVNEKLMRRLLISHKFHPSFGLVKRKAELLTKALTQLTQLTREIKFVITTKEYVPVFIEAFRILGSTKIQHINIFNNVKTLRAQDYQRLTPQPDLTSLKLQTWQDFRSATGCPSHLQIWIDAAPNLTSLDFKGCFYPHLEGCKNLTVLKFEFSPRYVDKDGLNLHNLIKMLGPNQ